MKEKLYNAQEVAFLTGISVYTLNGWYLFKKKHPRNNLARKLPKFIQNGSRNTRFWKQSDVYKIIEFKATLPRGRKGVMADVTQRYCKKEKTTDNESK